MYIYYFILIILPIVTIFNKKVIVITRDLYTCRFKMELQSEIQEFNVDSIYIKSHYQETLIMLPH